jgi:hypothetical protein
MENNPMAQITHEEARRLINFNADQPLDLNTGSILDAHLNECVECKKYASELSQLENHLRKMKHNFYLRPTPLHLHQIMYRSKGMDFGSLNNTMVTRITMLVMTFIVVSIISWQFLSSSLAGPAIPYTAIPIPTPSKHFVTSTNADFILLNCNYVPYKIQQGDTLDGIALQFSVSKEAILDFNGMKEEEIKSSMQIKIPTCNHAPTVTIGISSSTITITPQFEPITLTPG